MLSNLKVFKVIDDGLVIFINKDNNWVLLFGKLFDE